MSQSKHVVCSSCLTTNRVPDDRLAAGGVCGKCGKPLFNRKPIELTSGNFDRIIANNELPVMVDFWAPWCGPCKMMAPVFEQAAQQLEPNMLLAKLNTENEQSIAARFGIRSIPTIAVFKGGRMVAQQAGAMDMGSLTRWAQSQLR
ncbi:MAG: thioredoxin TrxC [Gammaproteobacteria bacterium]|nr:thioredoxin TrxC [Gammaproteobacteria bacterium]NNL07424.1 thioredoxin TrxC [Gammaproteobacteria bacterium]